MVYIIAFLFIRLFNISIRFFFEYIRIFSLQIIFFFFILFILINIYIQCNLIVDFHKLKSAIFFLLKIAKIDIFFKLLLNFITLYLYIAALILLGLIFYISILVCCIYYQRIILHVFKCIS